MNIMPDVLSRLPMNYWTSVFSTRNTVEAYKAAVKEGNFRAMRQAAFLGIKSSKIQRLIEIVEDAAANGHNVVIFSYFLNVLHSVHNRLGSRSIGIISGSVSPAARQDMVDSLEYRKAPSVLISQISAGGVGAEYSGSVNGHSCRTAMDAIT